MKTLTLNVPRLESVSTIWVGRNLIAQARELFATERASAVSIIADKGVSHITRALQGAIGVGSDRVLEIPGGERSKTPEALIELWNFFAAQRLDRRSLVIAIGGGATSDVVGFAAATFMRGIDLFNIPTTLLAQVDASIGGKTGINLNHTKNLVGVVSQPRGVLIDIDTLTSLPAREFTSGFAEIVKHGLIADRSYFDRATSKRCPDFSAEELVSIVLRSCEIKRQVVEADESEAGPRKTLNFGHTIGHAVESLALQSDNPLTHGEAVAIGMYGEATLSHLSGRISSSDFTIIAEGISRAGLPTHLRSPLSLETLTEAMLKDKKNAGGVIKWTLLNAIGEAAFDIEVAHSLVEQALKAIQPQT